MATLGGYKGVKVFSATMYQERQALGEVVTEWLTRNNVDVVDTVVRQSSDDAYHCLCILVFYNPKAK